MIGGALVWVRGLTGVDGVEEVCRCFCSLMYVSMRREYVSEWMFSIMIWKP